jgi:hypothetical protein
MKINKSLTLIGVIIVILSMTMATQYATTRAVYSFAIVHPSDADIRFIGSDNSSGDNMRVLRVNNNGSGTQFVTIELGSWMPNSQKNYTAAFAIVNEEQFKVNISYVNISGFNASYLTVWLHGDRDIDASSDGTAVKIIDGGTSSFNDNSVAWTLGAGDSNTNNMNTSGGGDIETLWDDTSHVRYSLSDWPATNETSDFVWVQISLDIESTASLQASTGTIYFHFKAATIS